MKLLSITKSSKADKKLMATFEYDDGSKKTIHFGASGYNDYTKYDSDIRDNKKRAYLARHKINEDWNSPDNAGSLSRWILWNKPTILESIRDYKHRFNL